MLVNRVFRLDVWSPAGGALSLVMARLAVSDSSEVMGSLVAVAVRSASFVSVAV